MTSKALSDDLVRETPVLSTTDSVADAVRALLASGLPSLPVADPRGRFAGLFGERDFIAALFPRYMTVTRSAGWIPRSLDETLEKRAGCRDELVGDHMNTDHIAVPSDYSDVQVAETFLHHRASLLPVLEERRVIGVIMRADFFRRLADRVL